MFLTIPFIFQLTLITTYNCNYTKLCILVLTANARLANPQKAKKMRDSESRAWKRVRNGQNVARILGSHISLKSCSSKHLDQFYKLFRFCKYLCVLLLAILKQEKKLSHLVAVATRNVVVRLKSWCRCYDSDSTLFY